MSKIVNVTFSGNTFATTERLWQYDYGQKLLISDLDLPEFYEVHFASSADGNAIVNVGDATGVDIPDKFLRVHGYMYAWFFLHDDTAEGHTKYQIKIPVEKRAKPPEDPPSSEQRDALAQAIDALNEQTERAEAWAVGQRGGEPVSEDDETYQNNAKFYSELAQQGANTAGWVKFYIDENGDLHYVKTANADLDFYIDASGNLHVTNGV